MMRTRKAFALLTAVVIGFGALGCAGCASDQPSEGASALTEANEDLSDSASAQAEGNEDYFVSEEGNDDNDL